MYPAPLSPRIDDFRTPFYVVLILYMMVEVIVVYLRDSFVLTLGYWWLVGHIIVLAGIGIYLGNRRFEQLFAAWYLFVNFAWQTFARMLGQSTAAGR